MTVQLLPICELPKIANRDGYAGANSHIYIPFYGLYFDSGQQFSFPSDTNVPQNRSRTLVGTAKPDTYVKDCCTCNP